MKLRSRDWGRDWGRSEPRQWGKWSHREWGWSEPRECGKTDPARMREYRAESEGEWCLENEEAAGFLLQWKEAYATGRSWEECVCCCARTKSLLKVHKTHRFVQMFVRECVRTSFSFQIWCYFNNSEFEIWSRTEVTEAIEPFITLHKRIAVQIEPLFQRKYSSRISISSIEGSSIFLNSIFYPDSFT